MKSVITDPAQATPHWLTDVLRREGVTARGEVERVQHEEIANYNSVIYRLSLRYSTDTSPAGPRKKSDPIWRRLSRSWIISCWKACWFSPAP